MPRKDYAEFAKNACKSAKKDWDKEKWAEFANHLSYTSIDATDPKANWDEIKKRLTRDDRICVFYLATTPRIYVKICEALQANGLNGPWSRLVLEKPIGTDLESAQAINSGVGAVFPENSIYRIDHYLGKETVQNLLAVSYTHLTLPTIYSV